MDAFERVSNATVRFTKSRGQGVLVPGGYILTAAHCITWDASGAMALGDVLVEQVEAGGRTLFVTPCAVEPVSDIAILGALDGQEANEQAEAFEAFCEATASAPICKWSTPLGQPFPIRVWSHKGKWLDGQATRCGANEDNNLLFVETAKHIDNETAGGPIVDMDGEIVGVVSHAGKGHSAGNAPIPHLSLPAWSVKAITRAKPGELVRPDVELIRAGKIEKVTAKRNRAAEDRGSRRSKR